MKYLKYFKTCPAPGQSMGYIRNMDFFLLSPIHTSPVPAPEYWHLWKIPNQSDFDFASKTKVVELVNNTEVLECSICFMGVTLEVRHPPVALSILHTYSVLNCTFKSSMHCCLMFRTKCLAHIRSASVVQSAVITCLKRQILLLWIAHLIRGTWELFACGQKVRTALSLVRVEREPQKALSTGVRIVVHKIIYAQTRANYVTIRSLCALAMPQNQ